MTNLKEKMLTGVCASMFYGKNGVEAADNLDRDFEISNAMSLVSKAQVGISEKMVGTSIMAKPQTTIVLLKDAVELVGEDGVKYIESTFVVMRNEGVYSFAPKVKKSGNITAIFVLPSEKKEETIGDAQ